MTKLTQLVRSYFTMDGHHIQFNVVDAETLLEAQKQPKKYMRQEFSQYYNVIFPKICSIKICTFFVIAGNILFIS
jgi:autonomous glycyl radical cofactor GrcA